MKVRRQVIRPAQVGHALDAILDHLDSMPYAVRAEVEDENAGGRDGDVQVRSRGIELHSADITEERVGDHGRERLCV